VQPLESIELSGGIARFQQPIRIKAELISGMQLEGLIDVLCIWDESEWE
jgi:hypothetical protein